MLAVNMARAAVVIKEEGGNMKICITSEGKTLDSKVDPRFGRCQNFIFFDTETGDFQAQENPNAQFQGGAGIQSGQLMASKGIKAVLTGNVGPNAFQTLNAGGIDIYTGISGSVQEAIEAYKSGKLKKTESPSVGSKFGMGKGR
jgi:predicted Fe-Mo cluster-binding NifX family protein